MMQLELPVPVAVRPTPSRRAATIMTRMPALADSSDSESAESDAQVAFFLESNFNFRPNAKPC